MASLSMRATIWEGATSSESSYSIVIKKLLINLEYNSYSHCDSKKWCCGCILTNRNKLPLLLEHLTNQRNELDKIQWDLRYESHGPISVQWENIVNITEVGYQLVGRRYSLKCHIILDIDGDMIILWSLKMECDKPNLFKLEHMVLCKFS